ncbi:HlyD family type I secretion periplasmic adaptor subunit [Maritimibacter sp. 55A14]|uniref:HlyD family type I secretion periplasmic adaptor subunit n=1 Tax=Maritimibacter sp. 55A14 TaxID=2174844 RepID=UPI000D607354|nr:HlyD family type I secretion periplasmic adaptor subunit [Maritimibacter sp. 55A14]PWE32912.1 HlyD family type I secretion periplasmic adaptor subunit [Maritimibacter sp. 55A14]
MIRKRKARPAPDAPGARTGLTGPARITVVGSLLLMVVLVGWAHFTLINGAVIASGQAVVRGKPKVVQSLDGGVVAEIRVKDGDVVETGDLLMRLDPTLLRINRDILRKRLAATIAHESRLEAEYLGLESVPRKTDASEHVEGLSLDRHYAGQEEIFETRREVQRGREEQLKERILQFGNQISGVEGQIESKRNQLKFIEKELQSARNLNAQGLARESQVLELQRAQASLLGELAEHQSTLARIQNSIRDTQLEILQSDREFKEQVVTELREVTSRHEELILEIVTIEKQLERVDILAPANGIIHELQVSTVGGVVAPEATILQIVPVSEGVEFEVRVDPNSIDQIFVGQRAKVQFPAFDMKTAPVLYGSLAGISPSTVKDPATGRAYYRVQLVLPPEELERLGAVHLVPGMPVQAFMQTGARSVLSYLTKPLSDQLDLAFREG